MIQRYFQAVWNSSCAAWPGTRLVICRTGPNCQLYNRDLAFELSGILFILGRAWAYSEALLVGLALGLGFPHLLSGLSKWAWPCHLPPIFLSPKELKNSIGLPIARVTLLVTRGLQKPLRRWWSELSPLPKAVSSHHHDLHHRVSFLLPTLVTVARSGRLFAFSLIMFPSSI